MSKTTEEIVFGFIDVTARGDVTLREHNNHSWARINDINAEEVPVLPRPLVTLEPDFGWPLDGKRELFPNAPMLHNFGWWSETLSGADGRFADPPTLDCTFTFNHSSAGITLYFDGALPGTLNIKWYDLRGTLLDDVDFHPDRLLYFADHQVENYARVLITVPTMDAPFRYLRVYYLLFGSREVLDDKSLSAAKLTEEISPIGAELPISTLEVSFFSANGRFSLLDPSGAYRLFQRRQRMDVYQIIDGQRENLGVYYVKEALGAADNLADLTCVDVIGLLDGIDFMGGVYDGYPAEKLPEDIFMDEDIEWTLAPALTGGKISGHLKICSKREALQEVAFALGAVVDANRRDGIAIYPAPTSESQQIPYSEKIVGHTVTLNDWVSRVDVTAHSYRLEEEIKEVSKSNMLAGVHTITFSTPCEIQAVTGATLKEHNQNYAVLSMPADGEVIVTGRQYADDTSVYTVQVADLPAGEKISTKTVTDAPLIDPSRAQACAQRVYDYYQLRYTDEGEILPSFRRTARLTRLHSRDGRDIVGHTVRVVTDLTGGGLATVTIRGR